MDTALENVSDGAELGVAETEKKEVNMYCLVVPGSNPRQALCNTVKPLWAYVDRMKWETCVLNKNK